MSPAVRLALASAGVFPLVGLASGVWRCARTMSSPELRATAVPIFFFATGKVGGVLLLVWDFFEAERS